MIDFGPGNPLKFMIILLGIGMGLNILGFIYRKYFRKRLKSHTEFIDRGKKNIRIMSRLTGIDSIITDSVINNHIGDEIQNFGIIEEPNSSYCFYASLRKIQDERMFIITEHITVSGKSDAKQYNIREQSFENLRKCVCDSDDTFKSRFQNFSPPLPVKKSILKRVKRWILKCSMRNYGHKIKKVYELGLVTDWHELFPEHERFPGALIQRITALKADSSKGLLFILSFEEKRSRYRFSHQWIPLTKTGREAIRNAVQSNG